MRREEEEGQEDDIIVHVGRNKVGGLLYIQKPKDWAYVCTDRGLKMFDWLIWDVHIYYIN